MNIKEMHYDYKQKLNKIDSQQYRNLRIPEIDWKLNEAIGIFVKMVAEPKYATMLGFEKNQRTIDDIRTLVVNNSDLSSAGTQTDEITFGYPSDYQHFVRVNDMQMTKGNCTVKAEKVYLRQHDDDFEASPFDNTSFLWREGNIRFYEHGIKAYTNRGEVTIDSLKIDYIKQHPYVHNAEDFTGGNYDALDGTNLTGTQDCILPSHTHSEIVDIAVLISTGDLQIPDYEVKRAKLNLTQNI